MLLKTFKGIFPSLRCHIPYGLNLNYFTFYPLRDPTPTDLKSTHSTAGPTEAAKTPTVIARSRRKQYKQKNKQTKKQNENRTTKNCFFFSPSGLMNNIRHVDVTELGSLNMMLFADAPLSN